MRSASSTGRTLLPESYYTGSEPAFLILLDQTGVRKAAQSAKAMNEQNRPAYHFTPRRNWMNDPNGLVYHNGEYHLFYQHNPFRKDWGHMSWGHAVSDDLIRWQHLPIALHEELQNNLTIFSGSAVVDVNNRSGFGKDGKPPILAIYTADYHPRWRLQNIHLAYSQDSGRTFIKYDGNPVLDVGDSKFGDPKVFWHPETDKWVMVNIRGEDQGRVVLYNSEDLKSWQYLSDFAAAEEAPGKWECPDLFPLAVDDDPNQIKWILKVNSTTGPVSKYFIGMFDGRRFHVDPDFPEAYDLNVGDVYAESTWNNVPDRDGRRILIGWIPQSPYQRRAWTGMLSIPRALTLHCLGKQLRVCQSPVCEIQRVRFKRHRVEGRLLGRNTIQDLPVPGQELEIMANFETKLRGEISLRLNFEPNNEIVIGYSRTASQFFVERNGKPRLTAPSVFKTNLVRFHLLIDLPAIEVFANQGEIVFTLLGEPFTRLKRLSISRKGGNVKIIDFAMWELHPRTNSSPISVQETV